MRYIIETRIFIDKIYTKSKLKDEHIVTTVVQKLVS